MKPLIDRHRDDTADNIRADFESLLYTNYKLGRMQEMLQHQSRLPPEMSTEEYFKRDARGEYVTNAVKLSWIVYKMFRDAATPAYYGARMWGHWVKMNDRCMKELPPGYTVTFNMTGGGEQEGGGFWIGLTDEAGEMVEYPDPDHLDGPGSMFKVVDSAVDAAITEHKSRTGA